MTLFWQIRSRKLFFEKTVLMGILNITPDSFSDGGCFQSPSKAVEHAKRLVAEGADLLDLGAESTRPGAEAVSQEEEINRILPCLTRILKEVDVPVSIDTTKASVAEKCLEAGAHMINDVSGLQVSGQAMAEVVSRFGAGLVLMHRRGNPGTMQALASYEDVTREVLAELSETLDAALGYGLRPEQLVIDPGIGFSKNTAQNLELLKNLNSFHVLGRPVLLGPSRKSFLGAITGRPPEERDHATAAVSALAVFQGVQILRVHDIRAVRESVRVAEAIRGEIHVRA